MKRPLSLLEVMIGLVLATILLTTLFSSFRELMQTSAKMTTMRQEKHWEYVLNVRLNQIFENVHEGMTFATEPYRDIAPKALHFAFNNGLDADPKFCQDLEAYLFLSKEKELCLVIEAKTGQKRKEIFLKKGVDYSIEFFDRNTKKWRSEWNQTVIPVFVRLSISGKVFQFVLPHSNRMVIYS